MSSEPSGAGGGDVLDSTAAGGMVIRGGAVRAAGYVIGTAVSLLGIALVARALGPADFGRFQTIVALIALVGTVTDAGLGTLGLREYVQREEAARERMIQALLGLRVALSLVGAGIAAVFAVAAGYDSELVAGTALQGLGLILIVWQTTLTIPLQARLRLVTVSGLDLLRQALTTATYAGLVIAGAATVGVVLAVPVGVGILVLAASAAVLRGHGVLPRVDLAMWRELLRISTVFVLATAVGTLYIYAAMLIMSLVADPDEVGLFAASFRVIIVIVGIPGLLVTAAFPVLARAAGADTDRFQYAVARVSETTLLLGAGALVVLVTGAPAIIEVAAGAEFADAASVLQIHAFALFASFVVVTAGFALLSLHLHRWLLIANLAAFLVSGTLVLLLGGSHGAEGGAIASVVGEITLLLGYLVGLRSDGHAIGTAPRVLAAATGGAALAIGAGLLSGLPSVPAAAVAVALYTAVVLLARAVPEELRTLVRRGRE